LNITIRVSCVLAAASLLNMTANPAYSEPTQLCDVVYGIHDESLNDSQFITLDPMQGFAIAPLGPLHSGLDIEAIDLNIHNELYAAAGDDSQYPGYLYRVNAYTGELAAIGSTGFSEIDGITFNPIDNSLWGWAQGIGLIQIDAATAHASVISAANGEFEDLTWDLTGEILYVMQNAHAHDPDNGMDSGVQHTLWSYNVKDGSTATLCQNQLDTLVGHQEIEALEMLPDGSLMLGYHNSAGQSIIAGIDPDSCAITLQENLYQVAATNYQDIEALAACNQGIPHCVSHQLSVPWQYVADNVGDATGLEGLDINGVAYKEDKGRITIAINARMGLSGLAYTHSQLDDNNVGFSDFIMDFDSVTYAVKFASNNDSNVTQVGLYRDVTLKDVTKQNLGWSTLKKVKNALKSKFSLGDIDNDTYFNWHQSRSVPMSIQAGTLVIDANFQMLDARNLAGMGLDFKNGIGREPFPYTFGFSFDRMPDMPSDFLGYFFTECINDGVAIMTQAPACD